MPSAVLRRSIGWFVAVDRDHQALVHGVAQLHREARQEIADVVEPQHLQGDKPPEYRPIPLRGQEPEGGRQEDPFAEADQLLHGGFFPAEPVATPRQANVIQRELGGCLYHPANDKRQHRLHRQRKKDHGGKPDHLRAQIKCGDTACVQMAQRGFNPRRVKAGQRQPGSGNWQIKRQRWRIVELRHWPGQQPSHQPQKEAAYDLDGPGGIEKIRLVPAFALGNGQAHTDVGKQRQSHRHHRDQGHQPEGFGEQDTCQHKVRRQPQGLAAAIADHQPRGGAQDTRHHSLSCK